MFRPGKNNLITDISGLYIGNSEDEKVKTGVTVLVSENPFTAGVKILGGAPGTRETTLLDPDKLVQKIDAIVLAGGSAFGLEAASEVCERLANNKRGFPIGNVKVPIIPSAILFDLTNGGNKDWQSNPYRNLGRKALESAGIEFSNGSVGAGFGALTSDLKGGLGSASIQIENGIVVAAIVAVNSVGSATIGKEKNFWAAPFEIDEEFGGIEPINSYNSFKMHYEEITALKGQSTTLAIVATNANINQAQATRVASAAHAGISRAIYPSHTPLDGDIVFAVATNEIDTHDHATDTMKIGNAAADCVSRSIAKAVYHAKSEKTDIIPSWSKKFNLA